MAASDTYKSLAAPSNGLYKDLGSKFLSFAFPVESVSQAREIIEKLRKEYFDARHHCYAYRIGKDGEQWRINDDGEPSSTAGKPIFGQLLSNELSDVLVVVVRYFGGTKLGVPGLIKAYKSAAADAISNASVIEKVACETFSVDFDYLQMNEVQKCIKDLNLNVISQIFDLRCHIELKVRLSLIDKFRSGLAFCDIKSISLCDTSS